MLLSDFQKRTNASLAQLRTRDVQATQRITSITRSGRDHQKPYVLTDAKAFDLEISCALRVDGFKSLPFVSVGGECPSFVSQSTVLLFNAHFSAVELAKLIDSDPKR